MQGLFGGLTLHLWLDKFDKGTYNSATQVALQQYATDFGDRRVLAGVHYPSDSMITWIICFKLIPNVVDQPDRASAIKFMKAAIRRSRVWTFIKGLDRKAIKCKQQTILIEEVEALIR
jgi:hypothetical protein